MEAGLREGGDLWEELGRSEWTVVGNLLDEQMPLYEKKWCK